MPMTERLLKSARGLIKSGSAVSLTVIAQRDVVRQIEVLVEKCSGISSLEEDALANLSQSERTAAGI
jgi:hypothetical protein